ncbi:MAG: ribbon-helix-helix protein, CopG family, partial [Candidatus Lokiarchaeota archaeon]|nr:ribbon-helix-helix protein, CopG family [Candidatus Lokiarchaeota archaeon]MBD3340664.1 ribbon-helix-helix protein, CopG family [Candidatus Lokiarchaeota archaeon]
MREVKNDLKIVTVNVPETYIDAMEKLVGEDGLYPSRSELIRCAVRKFLLKELKMAKNIKRHQTDKIEEDFDNENIVRVPIAESNEPKFKTYK